MSRIAIVISRFNEHVTEKLLEEAQNSLTEHTVEVIWVPGAFEIPLIAKKCAQSGQYDAIITLGAIIRGETPHFDFVADQVARSIATLSLDYEIPIIFGVLTTDNTAQALNRVDKGRYSAEAALEMITVLTKN